VVKAYLNMIEKEGKAPALHLSMKPYHIFIRKVITKEGVRLLSVTLNKTTPVKEGNQTRLDHNKLITGFLEKAEIDYLIGKLIEISEE